MGNKEGKTGDSHDHSGKAHLIDVLGLVATSIQTIAAIILLSRSQLEYGIAIAIAAGAWLAVALLTWRLRWRLLLGIGVSFVAITAIAVMIGLSASGGSPRAVRSTPPPTGKALAFAGVPGTAAPCAPLAGTGTIPAGTSLLIFDRSVDADHQQQGGGQYYFDGVASQSSSDTWETPQVGVGEQHVQVTGVVAEQGVAREFIARHNQNRHNVTPPAGLQIQLFLTRRDATGGCDVSSTPTSTPSAAASTTAAQPATKKPAPLAFTAVTGTAPPCTTLSGTGDIPRGTTLLVFDRSVDDALHAQGRGLYYFDGAATLSSAGHWTTPKVGVGEPHVQVTGVLTPEPEARSFLKAHQSDAQRQNATPPAGVMFSTYLTRKDDSGGC